MSFFAVIPLLVEVGSSFSVFCDSGAEYRSAEAAQQNSEGQDSEGGFHKAYYYAEQSLFAGSPDVISVGVTFRGMAGIPLFDKDYPG